MKILSCYIAGFGKFVNQAFDFTQNPVVVLAENGWGKTTLSVFLESMFFGLDAGRGKAVQDNPRLKYEPWSGGAFGGSLTFIFGGEKWRVERTFGRTPNADRARVYDKNNAITDYFGVRAEKLGEKAFGIDRESYRKTAYIPQGEIELKTGFPENLQGRLASLLSCERTGEENGALARLDEAERKLRAKRKPAKGILDEIDENLERVTQKLIECEKAEEKWQALEREYRQTEGAGLRTREKHATKKTKKTGSFFGILLAVIGLGASVFGMLWGLALLAIGGLLVLGNQSKKRENYERRERDAERKGWLTAQMESLREQAKARGEYEREKEELIQEKKRLERRLYAIRTAREILQKTRENLAADYLSGVEKRCVEYARFLQFKNAEWYFSSDGKGSLEEYGQRRTTEYYSEGERNLLGFCTRLALVEKLYEKEKPVLVLDDPFVHFDGKTLALAKRLVGEITKEWQVLYFTCSQERNLTQILR